MRTTHTRGPWTMRPASASHSYATADVLAHNGELLAITFAGRQGEPQNANANAALMASAPDLLAALVECLAWHDLAPHRTRPIHAHETEIGARMIAAARAAGAKAQGEG